MNIVMLVGLPGSGKTTFRDKLVKEKSYSYISSDEIRRIIFGDESFQGDNQRVFFTFFKHLRMNIEHNIDTVLDATHLKLKDRAKTFELINSYKKGKDIKVEAHIMNVSIDECIEREMVREIGKQVKK